MKIKKGSFLDRAGGMVPTVKLGPNAASDESDPEIEVIAALCDILELKAWKSLTPAAKLRCLEYFAARRRDQEPPINEKPASEKQANIKKAIESYKSQVVIGKDDYGRKKVIRSLEDYE